MPLKYVSAEAFTSLILLIASSNAEGVLTQAADQNRGASPRPNFITKFSLRWWQQYALTTRFPSTSSAFSNPLSRSDIRVHSSDKTSGIALLKCRRKYSHDPRDSDSTTAQANSVFCPLTSMVTARRSDCTKRAFKKVPSTARKRRQREKEARDCAGQMKQRRKLSIIQLIE